MATTRAILMTAGLMILLLLGIRVSLVSPRMSTIPQTQQAAPHAVPGYGLLRRATAITTPRLHLTLILTAVSAQSEPDSSDPFSEPELLLLLLFFVLFLFRSIITSDQGRAMDPTLFVWWFWSTGRRIIVN